MEFPFDINYVLPYEVTILNGDYRVLNQGQTARIGGSEKLDSIIDPIGNASFKAQGLSGAVTTARKFRLSDHRLYIIKKSIDNNNLGSAVGILKVGLKHLYIYDSNGRVHEQTPLCVLDFYVHESKQRLGYGKRLFDTMLEFEKCLPHELAIDRPSNKCLAFLQKHYQLSSPIHQVNNFVVYQAFFNQEPPVNANRRSTAVKQHAEVNQAQQEFNSWLMPSERQQRRPFSEQNEMSRSPRMRTASHENDLFDQRRPPTLSQVENRTASMFDERPPVSSYSTSYGQHYNPSALLREQNGVTHSAPFMPRSYSQSFNENNSRSRLSRNTPNPSMPSYSQEAPLNSFRRVFEPIPSSTRPEPLTSIYTFPTSFVSTNHWRQQVQQPPAIDMDTSSSWRLFGVHRLLN